MIFPIQSTFARTSYLGYLIGLMIFFFLYSRKESIFKRVSIFYLLIIGSFILIFNIPDIVKVITNFWSADVRKVEMFGLQTIYSRIGLWLRAIDVFSYSFPFGIGHGMYSLYINESFIPQISESIVFEKAKSGVLWNFIN